MGTLIDRFPAPAAAPAGASTAPARPPASHRVVLAASLLSFFVISLDGSVVNIALPAIQHSLHGGMSGLQWVVDGYILMFAAMMLSAGALSDRLGASKAYQIGLTLFTASSVVCGLAPNLGFLIGARVVQGVAAAVMVPTSLALIRQGFDDAARRAKAIAIWTAAGAVAVAVGPVAGGLFTEHLTWRSIFFVNLPAGLIGLALLRRIPASTPRPAPLDLPGQVAVITALAGLTFAVIENTHFGLTSPAIIAAITLAILGGASFLLIEARRRIPMVPLTVLFSRTMLACSAAGFALNAVFYGVIFLFGLYFQQIKGESASISGAMFIPMCGLIAGVNMLSVKVARRFGPRVPMVTGQLIMGAGSLLLLIVAPGSGLLIPLLALIPIGIGGGLAVPSLTATLLESIDSAKAGTAAAVLNTSRQVGGCLAVAIFGALVADHATFMTGLHTSLILGGLALGATAVATLTVLPRVRDASE
jgi:DHA2 family methylenomycin A resistance protein-like MFS transporter